MNIVEGSSVDYGKKEYPIFYNFGLMNGGVFLHYMDNLVLFRCHRDHTFYLFDGDVRNYRKNVKDDKKAKWCMYCRRSAGEQEIEKQLILLDLIFYREKPFITLVHKRLLRFDFYISEYKLLVEFDGPKHFPGIREIHTKELYVYCPDKLLDQLIRDQKKNQWCREYNHSLLRMPYWYFEFLSNLICAAIRYIKKKGISVIVDDLEDWRLSSIKRASNKKRILVPEKTTLQKDGTGFDTKECDAKSRR